jgi:C_GCAxxG_C_C family probable redox protein
MVTNEFIVEEFKKGFDCGQLVVSHFANELGISKEMSRKVSATFGAGTFKSETCGAVLGAYVVIGLRYGHCQEGDGEKKNTTIAKVKEFDEKFKVLHKSEVCREMLGYDLSKEEDNKVIMERGLLFSYCPNVVRTAVEILENL